MQLLLFLQMAYYPPRLPVMFRQILEKALRQLFYWAPTVALTIQGEFGDNKPKSSVK